MRDVKILEFVHFFVASYCAALEPRLPRKTSLGIVAGGAGEGSPFLCNATQVVFIQHAIEWMNYYAELASDFLSKKDAEKSAAQ
ncbi:hypothetical protein LY78DRAFT_654259 [Colletotrichum sublineola]|nr:hypothetical protein LY78DRAFT_654259 [Colletotrichum sublineola]